MTEQEKKRLAGHKPGPNNGYIHPPEAAEILGCSDMTVRRLCMAGILHGFRLTERGYFKIERASVERYRKARERVNFHATKEGRRR